MQQDAVPLPNQLKPELSVPQSLAVASIAGCGNVLVTNPIWLAVARMQAAGKAARSTTFVGELRGLFQEGGIPALWRVCLMRAVPLACCGVPVAGVPLACSYLPSGGCASCVLCTCELSCALVRGNTRPCYRRYLIALKCCSDLEALSCQGFVCVWLPRGSGVLVSSARCCLLDASRSASRSRNASRLI